MMKIKPLLAGLALALFSCVPGFAQSAGAQLGAGQVWGNPNASGQRAIPASISAMLDRALGSTRGAVIERGSSGWALIGPSAAAGLPFVNGGTGADPSYAVLGIVGGGTNCGTASGTCLDNITGFNSTGYLKRTGAGAYSIITAIPFSDMASGTSDHVLGYWGSTVISGNAVPNCTGALTYSTSTHTFGCNTTAGTGTVTSVGSGYGLVGGPITSSGTLAVSLSGTNNSLASDVTLNSSTYTDGPSVAQGSSGTWFASGNVTITDTTASNPNCKLWDGTTVIDSSKMEVPTNAFSDFHLSGYLASPAGNIRISCIGTDNTATMKFNASGNSKDSTLSVVRIQ